MTFDMSQPDADLAALIAQRLCHDLVNPLGAVGNGLELMAMTQAETPEMALMRNSLAQALGRIKLYRLAFGTAPEAGTVAGAEVVAALDALGGSRPLTVCPDLPAVLPRVEARLLALMALCAETALAWGGRLSAPVADRIEVAAEAPRLRLDPEVWGALADRRDPAAASPTLVQFSLALRAAAQARRPITVDRSEGRVALVA